MEAFNAADYTEEEVRLVTLVQARWRGRNMRRMLLNAVTLECEEGGTMTLSNSDVEFVVSAYYCGLSESVEVTERVRTLLYEAKFDCLAHTHVEVSDRNLRVRQYLGTNKTLRVGYIRSARRASADADGAGAGGDAAGAAFYNPKAVADRVAAAKKAIAEKLRGWRAARSFVVEAFKEAVDFSIFRFSLEIAMMCLLVVSTRYYGLFQAVPYFIIMLLLREGRCNRPAAVASTLFLVLNYLFRQFLFVGVPSSVKFGPFNEVIDTTDRRWYVYFGAYPSRTELFGCFACLYFFCLHLRTRRRTAEFHEQHDVVRQANLEVYGNQPTLTAYLSSKDADGVSVRQKLLALKERFEGGSNSHTVVTASGDTGAAEHFARLEALLPEPLHTRDCISDPTSLRDHTLRLYLYTLPMLCLFLVFIDGIAAAFITVIRMGKLGLSLYLFRYWDALGWRGNALWKRINTYFLAAVFVHLVWNVPAARHADYPDTVQHLLAFVGFTEYDAATGTSEAIQTNVFEVVLVMLLYLQRRNFDRYEHVYVVYASFREILESKQRGLSVMRRTEKKRAEGLRKAKEVYLERNEMLRLTRLELQSKDTATNPFVATPAAASSSQPQPQQSGEEKAGASGVSFPPAAYFDLPPPRITEVEREARKALRALCLKGYSGGAPEAAPAPAPAAAEASAADGGDGEEDAGAQRFKKVLRECGLNPEELMQTDRRLFRRCRLAFRLGQRVSGHVCVPRQYRGDAARAAEYVAGLLEGGHGLQELTRTEATKAFYDGKETAAHLSSPELMSVAAVAACAAVAAEAAAEKSDKTLLVRVVQFLYRHSYVGKEPEPCEIRGAPAKHVTEGVVLYVRHNSDLICYLVLAINFSITVSFLEMLPSLSAFVFAILADPGPPPLYWEVLLIYISALLAIKCVAQALSVSGIETIPEPFPSFAGKVTRDDFFWNVLGDFFSIVAVLFRQSVLKSTGLYPPPTGEIYIDLPDHDHDHSNANDDDAASTAPTAASHNNVGADAGSNAGGDDCRSDVSHQTAASTAVSRARSKLRLTHGDIAAASVASARNPSYYAKARQFYGLLTSVPLKAGMTRDLYIPTISVDFVSILLFIGLYSYLVGESNLNLAEAISQNLLPGGLVMGLIVLVLTMVVDRIIYLLASLKAKLVLQVVLAVGYHVGLYVWEKKGGSDGGGNATMSSGTQAAGAVVFLARCLWLFLSGKQIQRGFPEIRQHDCFTGTNHWLIFSVYNGVRVIPFLWEIRVLLDWSCSSTGLKLPYWLKLEDVRHEMYARKIDNLDTEDKKLKRGQSYPRFNKCLSGLSLMVFMLFLIFFPLLYYSTFSPALTTNSVRQMTVGLGFDGSPAFYQNDILIPAADQKKDKVLAQQLTDTRKSLQELSITNSNKNVQLISFDSYSAEKWSITPPAVDTLVQKLTDPKLGEPPGLVFTIDLQRLNGGQAGLDLKSFYKYPLSRENQTMLNALADLVLYNGTGTAPPPVLLKKFSPTFVFNRPATLAFGTRAADCELSAKSSTQGVAFFDIECRAMFACGNKVGPGDPETRCVLGDPAACPDYDVQKIPLCPHTHAETYVPFYYVAVSDMVSSSDTPLAGLFNVGIVALYVTFVLAIGKLIRGLLSMSSAVVFVQDVQNPSFVARLADHVHLARGAGDLALEADLYCAVINILRSPETLLRVTGLRTPW
eukprot:Rhum_TRINITY_DN15289_c9_g1::Rhum_TRINITY_DN15289_c9_g1_i1::g.144465::m.144465